MKNQYQFRPIYLSLLSLFKVGELEGQRECEKSELSASASLEKKNHARNDHQNNVASYYSFTKRYVLTS